jgi:hypothetical protein
MAMASAAIEDDGGEWYPVMQAPRIERTQFARHTTEFFDIADQPAIQQTFYNTFQAGIRPGNNFVEPPISLMVQTPLAEQTTAPDSSTDSPGKDTEHQKLSTTDHSSNVPIPSGVIADRSVSAADNFAERDAIAGFPLQQAAQSDHGQALQITDHTWLARPRPLEFVPPACPVAHHIPTGYVVECATEQGPRMILFTAEEWSLQECRYRTKRAVLGCGWDLGTAGYLGKFGPMDPEFNLG